MHFEKMNYKKTEMRLEKASRVKKMPSGNGSAVSLNYGNVDLKFL